MHLFFRTVGFSEFTTKDEEKFLKAVVKKAVSAGSVRYNRELQRGMIQIRTSEKSGLYIYGRFDGQKFNMDYYFPYLSGSVQSNNEEISVERHSARESYAVVCDEIKAGATLIFYLQNQMDYFDYMIPKEDIKSTDSKAGEEDPGERLKFNLLCKNLAGSKPINGRTITMAALSSGGMILLPISKTKRQIRKYREEANARKDLLAAAKKGDEEAIESLTIEEIDTYTQLSKRIVYEDVFSIVDSTFMPCGVECDQYSVIGEIQELTKERNAVTGEEIYIMTLECNDLVFDVAVNCADLIGEPAIGRRFKGQVWLQGEINF